MTFELREITGELREKAEKEARRREDEKKKPEKKKWAINLPNSMKEISDKFFAKRVALKSEELYSQKGQSQVEENFKEKLSQHQNQEQ